mgnify:FL=1
MKYTCACDRPPSERPVFFERDGNRFCTSCRAELMPAIEWGEMKPAILRCQWNPPIDLDHLDRLTLGVVGLDWEAWRDCGEAGA